MSNEREGSESRLLTGSTPPPPASPAEVDDTVDSETETRTTAATATMGDVLTKEHKDDNASEETETDCAEGKSPCEAEAETTQTPAVTVNEEQQQPDPPPPLPRLLEEPLEQPAAEETTTCASSTPEPTRVSCSPEPTRVSCSPEPTPISASPEPTRMSCSPEPNRVSCSPEPNRVSCSPEPNRVSCSPEPNRVSCSCSPEPTPSPEEIVKTKEDRLSGEVVPNGEATVEECEDSASVESSQQCHAASTTTDDLCTCEDCEWKKRDLSTEDLQEMTKLKYLGMDLRQYIRYTFNWFMETSGFSANLPSSPLPHQSQELGTIKSFVELRQSVILLCDRVPYHLFMWLVGQAQEFVLGVKVQLLTLLYDRSIDNLAEVFLAKLLDGYEALLATAFHISDLLEPLQKELFSKVNLTWEYINKSLYQNYVYSDPLIQNNLPPFIGQLRKHLPLKGSEYHDLVHRYLAFDDEITKIGTLCPEIEKLIDKYNAEQVTGSIMKKVREDFEFVKSRLFINNKMESGKEADNSSSTVQNDEASNPNSELQSCSLPNPVEIQSMFNDWKKSPQQRLADLVEALTLSSALEEEKKSRVSKEKKCYPSSLEKTVKEGINKSVSCEKQACKCQSSNPTIDSTAIVKQEKPQNLQNSTVNHCTIDSDSPKDPVAAPGTEPNYCSVLSRYSHNLIRHGVRKVSKTTTAQTAQTQTRHSTTQTPSGTHIQGHLHRHQGRCSSHFHLHGSLSNAVIKSSGPHRTHVGHNNHPSAAVTCHKQQPIVEHIKRLSTSDLSPGENGDCSDSGSSHEDSCSTTNSPTPRDSTRHCDCCYCEVFGHGVPSVAPVSRNYNEMRERLRQLLSKKKAKVCKAACNPHTKSSVEVSSSSSSLSSSSSTSSTITNVDSSILLNPASRSNTPVSTIFSSQLSPIVAAKPAPLAAVEDPVTVKPKDDHWNIEAAVEFIEGNQNVKKDKKKAEKKARQKQKKLEEKLKKEKEEEEQLRLLEIQKKTPEVTITVINPQKHPSKRSMQQHKLPEVSILPTAAPTPAATFAASKQANVKKKNGDSTGNNVKGVNKVKLTAPSSATMPTTENVKKKTASVDKINDIINVNRAKTKTSGKANGTVPQVAQVAVQEPTPDLSTLTKKERKKLRRRMEKQEALKKEQESKQQPATGTEGQSQIVTIKRIMESNNAEPTVTITLKGQTPAEDRVLFTLVNGQTKDSAGEKQSQPSGKKKKSKGNNSNNQQQQGQTANNKSQQSHNNSNNNNVKSEQSQKNDSKNNKQQQQQQQSNKDKAKNAKQQEEHKARQQQNIEAAETKSTKSKKDKKKNSENKENIKQVTNENSQKHDNNTGNKKSNKTGANQPHSQKQQQQQQQQQQHQQQQQQQQHQHQPHQQLQQHQQHQQPQQQSNSNNKNAKANKNQNQNQNQKKDSNSNQANSGKGGKGNNANNQHNNQNVVLSKIDNQKNSKAAQNTTNKQKQNTETVHNQKREHVEAMFNNIQREPHTAPFSINIENLRLPPGITITKVDPPTKPIPFKQAPPKPVVQQKPIIQPTNYGNPRGTGNVIVVDTGKLKQDLMPKNADKDSNNQSTTSKKKKKKKNKNSVNGNDKANNGIHLSQNNKQQQFQHSNDYMNVEPARILHNPSTNMVTIRNPAFGPPPPKMEPTTQQAAIIKVAENGMVTIRSPALQQAINLGLQPPPKPDFIVKGTFAPSEPAKPTNNSFIHTGDFSSSGKGMNGMQLSPDLAELRRRLGQPDNDRTTSTTLFNNGLSSIQISKVTNGQAPHIPENGINLKGTNVTLTKIRNTDPHHNNNHHQQQQHQQFEEPKGNMNMNGNVNGNASTKSRKKKKRGNGVRQSGDDWNLVESVFTPKDIDLEDGEMDDAERELEAFKRFCLQSVPPPRKEKVNLNIKDIVLKKKSSSSVASTAAAASAAATAAAVVAAI